MDKPDALLPAAESRWVDLEYIQAPDVNSPKLLPQRHPQAILAAIPVQSNFALPPDQTQR